MRKLLIFAAIEMEARAIARELGGRFASAEKPVIIAANPLVLEIHTIGIRAVRLPRQIDRAEGILMAGLGGALHPSLRIGDVIIDAASENLPQGLPFQVQPMHTSGEIIASPAARALLYRTHGAFVGEMENEIVHAFARERTLRYWGVRAISDTADQALDARMMNLVDELGRPKMGSVIGAVFRGPSFISQLKKMGDQAKTASAKLGGAVKILVDFWGKSGGGLTES